MKKVLTVCMALVMAMAMGLTTFAANGGFVSSPSGNKAPTVVEATNTSHECEADLVVTPYSERDTLDESVKTKLEQAYQSISTTTDLTKLNDDLAKIAEDKDIAGTSLAASDLFNIGYASCDTHNEHGKFDIKLASETLDKFVGLMVLDGDSWALIDDAKVDNDGELSFSTDQFGPYVIVVNTGSVGEVPDTGDAFLWIYVILALVSAAALITVGYYLKKKRV